MKKQKIYIIPTEYGFMYGMGIFICLIAGAVYNNNLAFLLCFFLVALFLIGMVQTHNNLKNIFIERIEFYLSPSHSAGRGVIWLKSQSLEGHSQIKIKAEGSDDNIQIDIPYVYKNSLTPFYFSFETSDWGIKEITKLTVSTRFPFGFFYVWQVVKQPIAYKIFPYPKGDLSLPYWGDSQDQEAALVHQKGNDFSEHRNYQFGESHRHIDWKVYARSDQLLVKKFEDGLSRSCFLDIDQVPLDGDEKYHQVCKWIEVCEQEQIPYALKLKRKQVAVGLGYKHRSQCLKAIASERSVS